jgi:hypothetical protein
MKLILHNIGSALMRQWPKPYLKKSVDDEVVVERPIGTATFFSIINRLFSALSSFSTSKIVCYYVPICKLCFILVRQFSVICTKIIRPSIRMPMS